MFWLNAPSSQARPLSTPQVLLAARALLQAALLRGRAARGGDEDNDKDGAAPLLREARATLGLAPAPSPAGLVARTLLTLAAPTTHCPLDQLPPPPPAELAAALCVWAASASWPQLLAALRQAEGAAQAAALVRAARSKVQRGSSERLAWCAGPQTFAPEPPCDAAAAAGVEFAMEAAGRSPSESALLLAALLDDGQGQGQGQAEAAARALETRLAGPEASDEVVIAAVSAQRLIAVRRRHQSQGKGVAPNARLLVLALEQAMRPSLALRAALLSLLQASAGPGLLPLSVQVVEVVCFYVTDRPSK